MRRVLREREFRLLWLGQSASTIGDRLVYVALALYVTEIGTPTDVGIVLAAHAVPFVAFLAAIALFATGALLPLGYLLAGPVGEALGASEVLFVGGVLALGCSALGFAIPDVWRLRSLASAG